MIIRIVLFVLMAVGLAGFGTVAWVATRPATGARMPGHPITTVIFTLAFWALALNTVIQFPRSAGIGVLILAAGVPVYFYWRRGVGVR